ncbi:MAG TPA: leucine--tRNA ligase [Candidatus Bilamarchaeum sp.]|nr:leucine--tRNA ligase [Candidatus Bilamarchaeum sp.]
MDSNAIEAKWSRRWADSRSFESDPDGRKKRYITAAFPYPNSPQHIGHGRTYTTADIYARYLRLRGYNVLYPMAFHVTGTPILAMAKRIAAKDREVLDVFENIYGISPEKAAALGEPRALVSYFSDEIERGMKEIGYSIDWRRKFYSYDEKFNRFIQWQFHKLRELGYLVKGSYPIAWCPSDNQAVSAHDTRGDIDPELEEVTAIKFEIKGSKSAVSASGKEHLIVTTYRPETIYGVTNIWVNPEIEYVRVRNDNDASVLIMSREASMQLDLQWKLTILGKVDFNELLEMTALNPVQDAAIPEVPVHRASFVKGDVGTGVVMSVPAHAPKDYAALRDLGKGDLRMPAVIKSAAFGDNPAKEIVIKMGVKDQDDPRIEEATKELYLKENSGGTMLVGQWKGSDVKTARDAIILSLVSALKPGQGARAYAVRIIAGGPVHCRCGARVKVNLLNDQWFIDYGKPEWKKSAKECLAGMSTIPEKTRSEFLYTIDWLSKRPTTRASGLGTRFPFDEAKMIEALSDSTIYMAFYTISHLLRDVQASKLDNAFFDYVFLGKGSGDEAMKKMRESFLYWYPVDSRHSAWDLVRNHLTLYIFNHVGVFQDKNLWPRQIVTNGFVLMDGKKMSKSMGNILPLRKAISEYGADVVRFSIVSGAELASDTDFNRTVAEGVRSRLGLISRLVADSAGNRSRPHGRIENWLLSRLNRKIGRAGKLYDELAIRDIALEIFYDVTSDLQWYMKRSGEPNLHGFFIKWVPLIAPFMPHYAEEYWEMLGGKGFVALSEFPEPDSSKIDDGIEQGEELIRKVHADIEKISELIGKKPSIVTVYVAAEWKRKLYALAKANPSFDSLMKAANLEKMDMKAVQIVAKQIMKNVHSLAMPLAEKDELDALRDAEAFLSREYSCKVEVRPEAGAAHEKAKAALPGKPAIVIE